MANPMSSAVTGMDASQQWMAVVGNNISNMNTVGYKASQVNFQSLLSQTLSKGSANAAPLIGGTNPVQVGTGVSIGSITPNFSSGSLSNTGNPNDLAISGNGFFVVSPSTSGSPLYYTRAGDFTVDSSGYLVDPNGNYLMGAASVPAAGAAPATWTPVNVNTTPPSGSTSPGAPTTYTIGTDGKVTVQGGATSYILLANVTNPDGLVSVGGNAFEVPSGGNVGTITYPQAGSGTSGTVQQGYLESSNVDLTQEMSNMIQAQTMYDGNSKMIQTVSGMYQFMLQQV